MTAEIKTSTQTVGIVIPAFNEATNLHRVLNVACDTPWLSKIIVVDDGSDDDTLAVAERYALIDQRVLALRSPKNQGKAAAMYFGIRALQTDTVIFLDADLINLKPYHLWQLYHPVELGMYDMTIAVFQHGRFLTDVSHRLTPNLSGQRCLSRSVAETILESLSDSRYGVEIGLTIFAKRQKWHIKKIAWHGITHLMKEQKQHGLAGIYHRRQMYGEILSTWASAQKQTMLPVSSIDRQQIPRVSWGMFRR